MSTKDDSIFEISGDFQYIRDFLKTEKLAQFTRATTRKLLKKPVENAMKDIISESLPMIHSYVNSEGNESLVNGNLVKDAAWQRESYGIKTTIKNSGIKSTVQIYPRSVATSGSPGGRYYIQLLSKTRDWQNDEVLKTFQTRDGNWIKTHQTHTEGKTIFWPQYKLIDGGEWVDKFYEDLYKELDNNGFGAVAEGLKAAHNQDGWDIPDITNFIEVDVE